MINFFKAISIILNESKNKHTYLKYKKISIKKSFKMISKDTIFSYKNIPFFKNSAMDGYAINISDINDNITRPIFFKITEKISAGDFIEKDIKKMEAIEIMTGARLPSKLDLVIKYEDTVKHHKNGFFITKTFNKFDNVKLIGEDFKIGDKVINNGKLIDIFEIMALSTIGKNNINVYKNPKFFLINTGNEITDKNTTITPTSIYNSSASYILSFLNSLNIQASYLGSIKDEIKQFINKIKIIWMIKEVCIFLTTGAVSKGKSDFIPFLLKSLGIKIHFHKVNIKPGKPILFAQFKHFIYFFCLPGNPVSTIIGVRFFVYNLLMNITGQNMEEPIIIDSKITTKFKKDTFLKTYSLFDNGILKNITLTDQESFKIKSLLKSNSFTFIKKNDNKKYIYSTNF